MKDNQSNLRQDLEDWFVYGDEQAFKRLAVDDHQTIDKSNGRIEIRRCWAIADPVVFEYIRHYEAWPDLQFLFDLLTRI